MMLKGGICRIAVPFFFLCSGYFYARTANKKGWSLTTLWGFLRRVYLVAIVWNLIYLMFHFIKFRQIPMSEFANAAILNVHYHFWYFPALIIWIALLHLLHGVCSSRCLLFTGLAIYSICLLSDSYYHILDPLPSIQNMIDQMDANVKWASQGFVFVVLGALEANRTASRKTKSMFFLGALFLLLFLAEVATIERLHISKGHMAGILLIPATYYLFLAALKWNPSIGFDASLARNISIIVYCIHPLMIAVVTRVGIFKVPGWPSFISVVLLSCGSGYFIVKSRFRLLRVLY
jgi:serine/alanine racemase